MSLQLKFRIALHIKSFKNVNLYHQGNYYAEFRFYYQTSKNRYFAAPFDKARLKNRDTRRSTVGKWMKRSTIDTRSKATFDKNKCAYKTNGFNIKYIEEECDLNEVAYFDIVVDVPKQDHADEVSELRLPLNMEVSLFYADFPKDKKYQRIGRKSFRLGNLITGIYKFVPVEFSCSLASIMYTSVHCTMWNLKFSNKTVFQNPSKAGVLCEPREREDMMNSDPWDELEFEEYSTSIEKNATKREYIEEYLFSSKTLEEGMVSMSDGLNALEYICSTAIAQYNKLRDSFKALYIDLKEGDTSTKIKRLRPSEKRKKIEDFSFNDDRETSESNTVEEFLKREDSVNTIRYTQNAKIMRDIGLISKRSYDREVKTRKTENNVNLESTTMEEMFGNHDSYVRNTITSLKEDMKSGLDPETVIENLFREKVRLITDLKRLWVKYAELLKINQPRQIAFLEYKYYVHFERAVKKRTVVSSCDDLDDTITDEKIEYITKKAESKRNKYYNFHEKETARGLCFVRKQFERNLSPIIFEEIYRPESFINSARSSASSVKSARNNFRETSLTIENNPKPHLIFLLHGYQGSEEDVERIHDCLVQRFPCARVYSIKSAAENKNLSIADIGEKVADEMTYEIEKSISKKLLNKITLIGHSLGGLIFRAALPHLRSFKRYFNAFISLGTPHLGYFHSNSNLLSFGMWLFGGFKGCPSLKEIRMQDSPIIENTYLYQLSEEKGLNWFDYVVFVGSHQDSYSPVESSMVQLSKRLEFNRNLDVYDEMKDNILHRIKNCNVFRLTIDFDINEGGIDNYIGRKAHIELIENSELLKMIFSRYSYMFK